MDSSRKNLGWDRAPRTASSRPLASTRTETAVHEADSSSSSVRVHRSRQRESALRESESRLTQALRLAEIGTWEYDLKTRDFSWSDHFFRMLGVQSRNGRISVEEACAFIRPDQRSRMWEDVARLIASGEPLENEFSFVRPNGDVRVFHSRAVPVRSPSGDVTSIRGMSQDVTDQKRIEDDLHRLSQQLMQLRDQERRRTARQLHETAVQSLAALKMTLARLWESMPQDKEVARALHESCLILAEESIQEVRLVSYLMHPPMLDVEGLAATLKWFGDGFARRSGIQVTFEGDENLGRFPQEIETSVFRIAQEALTNLHRHSGSNRAEIRLRREGSSLRLEIQDFGRGMPPATGGTAHGTASLGVGISGMRERVTRLQGRFEISSSTGRGTLLRAILPLATLPAVKENDGRPNPHSKNRKARARSDQAL